MNIEKLLHTIRAEAHCDIPCGIYDPTAAKVAAKTVARMAEQLDELPLPKNWGDKKAVLHYMNDVSRKIAVKEEHAEACKHEIEILWSDFFKPEHLKNTPELHTLVWEAVKLCSQNKQGVDSKAAAELVIAVDKIASIFYEAKGVPERFEAYKKVTDNLY